MEKALNKMYGCIPSTLDGSERIINVDDKIKLPEEFDLRDVMPPVRNQGVSQTCVCQTLTGVLDYLHNAQAGTDRKCNNFSINTLYESRSNKPQDGMSIKEALGYLKKNGLNGEKINSYALVPNILALKYALVMFGPCAMGAPVYMDNDPYYWRKGNKFMGGHCTTVVGYNKKGFIMRNSWGPNWAEGGYITIPYDEYEKCVFETWTVLL